MHQEERSTSLVVTQFLLTALTWGMSFVFIKVCLKGLGPIQVAFGRALVGALALGLMVLITRSALPRTWSVWGKLFVLALFMCVIPFLLISTAQAHLPSGMGSILNATTPLMTALIATVALRDDRITRAKAVGLVLGFAGVVLLMAPWSSGWQGDVLWQVMFLGATCCYGIAIVFMRRFVAPLGLSSLVISFGQVSIASLVLVAVAPWAVFTPPKAFTWTILGALLALGALGTGLAYVWQTNVIKAWGATLSSSVTYLVPLVGVIAGIVLLHERPTWNEFAGGTIIVAGVLVMQRVKLRWPRRRTTPPPPSDMPG